MRTNNLFLALMMGIIIVLSGCSSKNYDSFVGCLNEKGVTFYGAFWCPHCQNQKKIFGSSANDLPYVECSTSDGKSQTQVCIDAKIKSYPTWEFADGTKIEGEMILEQISSVSGCKIENG